jgi:hypothetical protein
LTNKLPLPRQDNDHANSALVFETPTLDQTRKNKVAFEILKVLLVLLKGKCEGHMAIVQGYLENQCSNDKK